MIKVKTAKNYWLFNKKDMHMLSYMFCIKIS